jgi:hypothetical protein
LRNRNSKLNPDEPGKAIEASGITPIGGIASAILVPGSIKGNVKRKFFPRDGGVGSFSPLSPLRQNDSLRARIFRAAVDVFAGFMMCCGTTAIPV